jgi:hypothetical protein
LLQHEAVGRVVAPPDRAEAGNQADPVRGQDEDEHGAEEPERLLYEVAANDVFEERVEAFDEPLQKVLRAARHLVHLPRRQTCEHDQAGGDDPRDEHRVGNRKPEHAPDLDGAL